MVDMVTRQLFIWPIKPFPCHYIPFYTTVFVKTRESKLKQPNSKLRTSRACLSTMLNDGWLDSFFFCTNRKNSNKRLHPINARKNIKSWISARILLLCYLEVIWCYLILLKFLVLFLKKLTRSNQLAP